MTSRKLKTRRARLGLTQGELAKAMGVRLNTVARWETDQRRIPPMAAILLTYIERDARQKGRRKEGR